MTADPYRRLSPPRPARRRVRDLLMWAVRAQVRALRIPGDRALIAGLYDPARRQDDYVERIEPYEGGVIQVDTRSFIEWAIYVFGGYELASVRLLAGLARPGAVVLDVGANIGTFTIPLAHAVGAEGVVHTFEPHPRLRSRLLQNLALNNLQNVVVSPLGLSSQAGSATLYGSSSFNQGASSLRPSPDAREPFECELSTVDDYTASLGMARIDIVKVDTEGSDLSVLLGARSVLERCMPHVLVEANPIGMLGFGSSPQELLRFLLGLGYRVWRNNVNEFERRCRLVPLRSPSEIPPEKGLGRGLGWENWLAVHERSAVAGGG